MLVKDKLQTEIIDILKLLIFENDIFVSRIHEQGYIWRLKILKNTAANIKLLLMK